MKSQAKVKFLILLAVIVLIALFSIVGFQLIKISQIKKEISNQQNQIDSLQQQLDYYEKLPSTDHDSISGEN